MKFASSLLAAAQKAGACLGNHTTLRAILLALIAYNTLKASRDYDTNAIIQYSRDLSLKHTNGYGFFDEFNSSVLIINKEVHINPIVTEAKMHDGGGNPHLIRGFACGLDWHIHAFELRGAEACKYLWGLPPTRRQ